jgi:hypothetical protein
MKETLDLRSLALSVPYDVTMYTPLLHTPCRLVVNPCLRLVAGRENIRVKH